MGAHNIYPTKETQETPTAGGKTDVKQEEKPKYKSEILLAVKAPGPNANDPPELGKEGTFNINIEYNTGGDE